MAAIARESFAQLLRSIDIQEQEWSQKQKKTGPDKSNDRAFILQLPADASDLASLAWGLHKGGRCSPVLLDALAILLLPGTERVSGLTPEEALRLITACSAVSASKPRDATAEEGGARQLLEAVATAIWESAERYSARQAAQVAVQLAAAQHFDERLMR